jgi:hypothetical protein
VFYELNAVNLSETEPELQGNLHSKENAFGPYKMKTNVTLLVGSAIFLKTIASGTHSDPKFGRRGGDVTCIDARGKFRNAVPSCVLLRKNFRNVVPVLSAIKYPCL